MKKISLILLRLIGTSFIILCQTIEYEGKYIDVEHNYCENKNYSVDRYAFLKDTDTLKIEICRPVILYNEQLTTIKNFDILGNNIFLENGKNYKFVFERVDVQDTIFYPYHNNGQFYEVSKDSISYPPNNITYGRYVMIDSSQYYIKQLFIKNNGVYEELHPSYLH